VESAPPTGPTKPLRKAVAKSKEAAKTSTGSRDTSSVPPAPDETT
jgi:hypothetical protein